MTTSKALAHNPTVTITLASLANNTFVASSEIDNSSNLDTDGWLVVKLKTGASGVSATGLANVYLLPSADNGTTYPDSTANGGVLLGAIALVANATTYIKAFRLVPYLPKKFKVAVENQSGAALDSTGGSHAITCETYSIQTA